MRARDLLASETLFLVATAVAAAIGCALAFARFQFLGLAFVGLVALFVTSRLEMDADATGPMTSDLRPSRSLDAGENAGLRRRAERSSLSRSLRFVRLAAGALLLVGAVGFLAVRAG